VSGGGWTSCHKLKWEKISLPSVHSVDPCVLPSRMMLVAILHMCTIDSNLDPRSRVH
jgi:hypothetical protein